MGGSEKMSTHTKNQKEELETLISSYIKGYLDPELFILPETLT